MAPISSRFQCVKMSLSIVSTLGLFLWTNMDFNMDFKMDIFNWLLLTEALLFHFVFIEISRFSWGLFLTIRAQWFRWWLGTENTTNRDPNQWWHSSLTRLSSVRINIKIPSQHYRSLHYKDKISQPSCLYNGNPYRWKMFLVLRRDPGCNEFYKFKPSVTMR